MSTGTQTRTMLRIGTSGWQYSHWKGQFYPENLSPDQYLRYYSERFDSVEVNNSFYQLPEASALRNWYETVHEDFVFAIKAGRYITHVKRLREPERTLDKFLKRISVLEDKLGPILFQLPPKWSANPQRLQEFLQALPGDFQYAFEFRDESWFSQEIQDLLSEYNAAFCVYEFDGSHSPVITTADFVYVRLHGPEGKYRGSYDHATLESWADRFTRWRKGHKSVYCFFDNDENGYAARNALSLEQIEE